MATDKDRYAPLKESQPELSNKKPEQGRAVEQERPPLWTEHGGMVEQQHSAMESLKYKHEQRGKSRDEAGREAPNAPEQRQARNYNDLKVERAKSVGQEREDGGEKKKEGQRKLTFYKDLHPEHDKDRGRGR